MQPFGDKESLTVSLGDGGSGRSVEGRVGSRNCLGIKPEVCGVRGRGSRASTPQTGQPGAWCREDMGAVRRAGWQPRPTGKTSTSQRHFCFLSFFFFCSSGIELGIATLSCIPGPFLFSRQVLVKLWKLGSTRRWDRWRVPPRPASFCFLTGVESVCC